MVFLYLPLLVYLLDITFDVAFIVSCYSLIGSHLLLTIEFINESQLLIGGVFIVGVSDWQFTFIDASCYLLVIVLVTLDIDFEVVVYFWSWYLYVDLV